MALVKIITGAANSTRERQFMEHIKQAVSQNKDVLVMIPDQFSFEYDKGLYKVLGAQAFNSITTAGIDRLCETISAECGGTTKDKAEDNAQVILMFKAVKRFSKEGSVRYFKRSLGKGKFIGELLTLVHRLRESGVTPESLRLAAERLEGSVSLKLFDIAFIYRYYLEEIENAGMSDILSRAAEAAVLAEREGFFKGKSVFITGFYDLTYDQLRLISSCIRDSDEVTFSILIDDDRRGDLSASPFAVTVRTRQQIIELCRDHDKPFICEKAEGSLYVSQDIRFLGERIFDFRRDEYTTESDDVQVWCADDSYEEADFICAEICRLVNDKKYRFNDIAVALRDSPGFSFVLESAFAKYDIPYFIDRQDSVDASAIVHYINALFRSVLTRKFRTENILRLMKSQLMGLMNYEVGDLEDYCIRWGVDGDMWLTDFTADPSSGVSLERINKLRASIIEPLLEFKNACQDSTAAEISRAFYKLLSQVQLSEQTYSLVRRASASDNETVLELARGLKQLWSLSLSAVGSIHEILGDEKISLRRYYELYGIMLSRQKIASPPQKTDCVRVIDAGRSRIDSVKAVFAAEVNDGVFPAKTSGGGLVTEHEKELLKIRENIVIEANVLHDLRSEHLAAYAALCAPTERLYVLYSRSDLLGNERRPSVLVKEVCEILGIKEKLINTLSPERFCTSYKTAFSTYIAHSREKTPAVRAIYESLLDNDEYYSRLRELEAIDPDKPYALQECTAKELFFGEDVVQVSPTKLDNYYKCPFMYFCSYGLKLGQERKMDMDGLNKGLIVHKVLECAVPSQSDPKTNRQRFLSMTDEEIHEIIDRCFKEYYTEEFCGDFGKTGTFAYSFEKLRAQTFYIVKFVRQEMMNGGFAPAVVEYKIDRHSDGDHLDLTLKDGRKIILIGTIDRADIYEDENGEKFVRIVDYKYRKSISFSLAELYCGLGLQMLVYLSLMLDTDAVPELSGLKQAGVFYLKLYGEDQKLRADCELSEEELYKAACENAVRAFTRDGRIADLEGVAEILDPTITKQKLNSVVIENDRLTALREYAKSKVVEYGDRLLSGNIDADPLKGSCSYCIYQGICGRAFPDHPRTGTAELMEQVLDDIIEKKNGREGE